MSEDPFREYTAITFLRCENVDPHPEFGWSVKADPRIAIAWFIGFLLLVASLALWLVFPPAACGTGIVAILCGLAAIPIYNHENRSWKLEVRPDGFQVGPDRVRWADVEGFEAVEVHAISQLGDDSLAVVRGLLLRTKTGTRVYPTWSTLPEVEVIAARLEGLRVSESGPLPEDAKRVQGLRERE